MHTRRLASPDLAHRYPLPISGEPVWQRQADSLVCEVDLPALAEGDIVVPSFACAASYDFRASLFLQGIDAPIAAIDTRAGAADTPDDARVRTHIDYFSIHARLDQVRMRFEFPDADAPPAALVTVSVRSERLPPGIGHRTSARLVVPALTQLTAPRTLRRRICAPTCVTMVLRYFGCETPLSEVVGECLHKPSGIYGMWPLSIRAAARRGVIGAVEFLDSLDAVADCLARGAPVVASIRFEAGALPGAPLPRTDGHLVVVTGIDRDTVHVNDPASPQLGDVPRSYDRAAFAAAWLAARGAAYIFCAPVE
jgi:hypothetical protein